MEYRPPERGSDAVSIYLKSNFSNSSGVSYDRLVTVNSVVPEPSAITLLGIGLAGLCGFKRLTRAKSIK